MIPGIVVNAYPISATTICAASTTVTTAITFTNNPGNVPTLGLGNYDAGLAASTTTTLYMKDGTWSAAIRPDVPACMAFGLFMIIILLPQNYSYYQAPSGALREGKRRTELVFWWSALVADFATERPDNAAAIRAGVVRAWNSKGPSNTCR